MQTININSKEYLLDIEKAKSQGLLKEKDNRLYSWDEYIKKHKYGKDRATDLDDARIGDRRYDDFNLTEEAEAFCALGKLIQLRDAWWGDWRPNWEEDTIKYSILSSRNRLLEYTPSTTSHILSFPTAEMRNDFFDTFRDLIEQAKMFL